MGFFSINKEVFPIGICLRGPIRGTRSDGKLNLLLIRDFILQNISLINCLIPLLRNFFENLKYLKPYYIILKRLIGNKMKQTIYWSLEAYYYNFKNLIILFLETS